METKEFIKRVEKLGYKIIETSLYIFVDKNGAALAMISKEQQYKIETFNILSEACGDELFSICYEYARTPIDKRGEEEKFYLQKIKDFYDDEESGYLNFDTVQNIYFISSKSQYASFKTQFTQKEIDKIKQEQHTDLSEFKQIPVEEIENEI